MTRTTGKPASVHKNDTLSVPPDRKAILPDVLIENWRTYEKQLLILNAGELSGRTIQDLYHVCNYGRSPIETRRVYGVTPVNCKLQILNSQDGYQMQLCGSV